MKLGLATLTLGLGLSVFSTQEVQAESVDYGNGVHCDDENGCTINYSEAFQQSVDRAIESYSTGLVSAPVKSNSKSKPNQSTSKTNNDPNPTRPEPGTTTGSPSMN
ncbi:leucocin A/sakacin P family class II bacteriocin [Oceanobacillus jeddahense]|uniref:Class II bacteriocin n=2 Tax=Oceanobacillus jeddahense TaxID=1462527 RepID=A0ABY5JLF9_9BACI|nr:leucocin A/sakacin P family class II bacteriocin [Oceanobacillus jeddahense]UUI01146.1 class II bacteriocin [Oceanobacillus jeddahense]